MSEALHVLRELSELRHFVLHGTQHGRPQGGTAASNAGSRSSCLPPTSTFPPLRQACRSLPTPWYRWRKTCRP